jgi:hypothetical protein
MHSMNASGDYSVDFLWCNKDARLRVANLTHIIKSKRAAGRPRDLAVLPILDNSLKRLTRKAKREALKNESELALRDQIRRLLALRPDRRTHFPPGTL